MFPKLVSPRPKESVIAASYGKFPNLFFTTVAAPLDQSAKMIPLDVNDKESGLAFFFNTHHLFWPFLVAPISSTHIQPENPTKVSLVHIRNLEIMGKSLQDMEIERVKFFPTHASFYLFCTEIRTYKEKPPTISFYVIWLLRSGSKSKNNLVPVAVNVLLT